MGPQLGYLPQDIELFDGTVAENIARFGEVDPDLVVQAATDAGVHNMILALPEWLRYGHQWSRGQLSLANASAQRWLELFMENRNY